MVSGLNKNKICSFIARTAMVLLLSLSLTINVFAQSVGTPGFNPNAQGPQLPAELSGGTKASIDNIFRQVESGAKSVEVGLLELSAQTGISPDDLSRVGGPLLQGVASGQLQSTAASLAMSEGAPILQGAGFSENNVDLMLSGAFALSEGKISDFALSKGFELASNEAIANGILSPETTQFLGGGFVSALNGELDEYVFNKGIEVATAAGTQVAGQVLQAGLGIGLDEAIGLFNVANEIIDDPVGFATDAALQYGLATLAANGIPTSPGEAIDMIMNGGLADLVNAPEQLVGSLAGISDFIGGGTFSPEGIEDAILNSNNPLVAGAVSSLGVFGDPGLAGDIIRDVIGGGCNCTCEATIPEHYKEVRNTFKTAMNAHEDWLLTTFFHKHILPALKFMTMQLTTVGMQQVQIIGSFFDAKHQLETQRTFQTLQAEAHKDYHPSEGLCVFGTATRSLATSEKLAEYSQMVIASRAMQRQMQTGTNLAAEGSDSDKNSRLKHYAQTYCNPADNNFDNRICRGTLDPARFNKDIDYTNTVENKLTLDLDFTRRGSAKTSDEEDIFALGANLYGHDILPRIDPATLADEDGDYSDKELDAMKYLDVRRIAAISSAAHNSYAAITGMKARGSGEVDPYLYKLVQELGVPDDEIDDMIGKDPSYFAQMEILTKKIYQNPKFYTDLYDKPANVSRKDAVLQAIGLIQDRDYYRSLLRSEIILSLLLEMEVAKEQAKWRRPE